MTLQESLLKLWTEFRALRDQVKALSRLDILGLIYKTGTWTPTVTGFAGTPTITNSSYWIIGRLCFINLSVIDGTSNATTFTFSLPFASAVGLANAVNFFPIDNGNILTVPQGYIEVVGSTAVCYLSFFHTAWTAANRKAAFMPIWSYPI